MDTENAHTVFFQIRSWLIAKALIVSFHCFGWWVLRGTNTCGNLVFRYRLVIELCMCEETTIKQHVYQSGTKLESYNVQKELFLNKNL